jgi:hypothetical protein
MTMIVSSASAVAERAAAIITERGLCKFQNYSNDGRACIAGAVEMAAKELCPASRWNQPYMAVLDVAGNRAAQSKPELGTGFVAAIHFSNHPDVTQDEIANLLHATAIQLSEA